MADPSILRQRAAAVLSLIALTLLAAGSAQLASAAGTAAPTPRLHLSWAVVKRECWIATERVRVRRHKKVTITTRRVRRCGDRAVPAHGGALHLAWREHGEVFGRLTLAGKPIAGAPVTLTGTIINWQTNSATLTTDAQGRFSAGFFGPVDLITLSYQYAPGKVIATTHPILASDWLSLHVGNLVAGQGAHFYGSLAGHYIPRDLYIQFFYWAGYDGWLSLTQLAIVNPRTGRWSTQVTIPAASAGYTYDIRAQVVPSPYWPWAQTRSPTLVRYVPY